MSPNAKADRRHPESCTTLAVGAGYLRKARIVRLLVERVEVSRHGADIRLRIAGLTSLMQQLRGSGNAAQRAAA